LEARAALRLRRVLGSSVPALADALEPPLIPALLEPPVPLDPMLELEPPVPLEPPELLVLDRVPVPAPLLLELPPLLLGSAAPIWPAAVLGLARPALSVSAGDPCAAYAPANAADMHTATKPNVSFLMHTSRISDPACSPFGARV
jgi:hypothetical protein